MAQADRKNTRKADPRSTDVRAIGLSVRTTNALVGNGVVTVEDLLALPEGKLLALRGIGAAGAKEVREALRHNLDETLVDITETLEDLAVWDGGDLGGGGLGTVESSKAKVKGSAKKVLVEDLVGVSREYSLGEFWQKSQRSERNFEVLIDYYNSGAAVTLQDLAERYGISRQRVSQIITRGTRCLREAFVGDAIKREVVVSLETYASNRTEVSGVKVADNFFTEMGAVRLVVAFKPKLFKIFTSSYLSGAWFVWADDEVEKIVNGVYRDLRHGVAPLQIAKIKEQYGINEDMLMSIKGIVREGDKVTHEGNGITAGTDTKLLVAGYLEKIDRPATIEEISEQVKLTYDQVRGALGDKSRYANVGKSMYDLARRKYEQSTVAELATKILIAEDSALKIGEVVKYVQKYKVGDQTKISLALLNAPEFYCYGGYLLLADWPLNRIHGKRREIYNVTLEDAILRIINASEEVFDSAGIIKILREYGGAVSQNPASIKAALVRLAEKGLIVRVGGAGDNRYTRRSDVKPIKTLGAGSVSGTSAPRVYEQMELGYGEE